ncbi:hypothetical protein ACN38_g12644, partial [Penicillium nordicum]
IDMSAQVPEDLRRSTLEVSFRVQAGSALCFAWCRT